MDGATALHYAVLQGHEEALSLLLNHGAKLDLVDHMGKTPLDWAVQERNSVAVEMLRVESERRGQVIAMSVG